MKASPRQRIGRRPVVSRVPEILRRCRGRKVLHLGCADAPYTLERGDALLHRRLAAVTSKEALWGVDSDARGVALLREMGFENVLHGDCERLSGTLRAQAFDVVLAGELLEHLDAPGRFLRSVAGVMTEETELLLTTPNATALKGFVHAFAGGEKVHPDHHCYFSYHTLRQLLEKTGLRCREELYYQDVEGRGLGTLVDRGFRMAARLVPAWSDGVIAVARLEGAAV